MYQIDAIAAIEALKIGINWLLALVVKVNNNPDNPAISIRAFADRPKFVWRLHSSCSVAILFWFLKQKNQFGTE